MMTALPYKHYSGHRKATEEREIKNTKKRDLEKMSTAGFNYSWRKMAAAA